MVIQPCMSTLHTCNLLFLALINDDNNNNINNNNNLNIVGKYEKYGKYRCTRLYNGGRWVRLRHLIRR